MEYAGTRGKASFAREIGISPSTYDYYENSRVPPADVLVRISELTNGNASVTGGGEKQSEITKGGSPAR